MKWKPTRSEPTPEQLAAWADGELDRREAERVEAWLAARHEADAETSSRLDSLYRDHPPPEPSESTWQATFARIDAALCSPASPSPRLVGAWRFRLLVGLVAAAAAIFAGVLVARGLWVEQPVLEKEPSEVVDKRPPAPGPAHDEPDEPFPVATASEVNIISVDAEDADKVLMGQPLMGDFEVASPEDIEIVKMEPSAEDGQMPQLHRGSEVPMILASAGRQEP